MEDGSETKSEDDGSEAEEAHSSLDDEVGVEFEENMMPGGGWGATSGYPGASKKNRRNGVPLPKYVDGGGMPALVVL